MTDNQKTQETAKLAARSASRSEAIRAQRRSVEAANKIANEYQNAESKKLEKRANLIDDSPRLKVIGLGGMDGGGSKNMLVIEYLNDALVIDAGNDLGVDLPGINYAIADTTYLETIRHKIKGYVISHGHLDHIGGLPHIVPKFPASVFGSKFTIGRVEEIFENFGLSMPEGFELKTVVINETTREKIKIGAFFVELVRVTHSIPGATAIVIDSPVGRIIISGDFRLDPNPLDHEKTDMDRLKHLGEEGVLLLLSESTTTDRAGRTPSESIIEPSFIELFNRAPGRVFIAIFSTNINRIQMVINAAVHHGRKIALDGRSMMSTLEMAVRNGFVKVPKGTFIPIASANNLPDEKVVVICTGSQGETNSALMRMSTGDHKHIKLKPRDTVILSSTPIPESGNDAMIGDMVDDLMRKGVHIFQHATHELDNIGPLHVSGHGSADEYKDMIRITKPKFFVPIYGSYRSKQRHIEYAVEEGIPRDRTFNAENGDVISFTGDKMEHAGQVPHGTVLVDQTGAIVSNVVVKDRLMMAQDGLVAVVLTIDKKNGSVLTSPDIISRGFIYMRDNEELMNDLRSELRRAVQQRFKRVELDRFKQEIKEHVTHFLYERTQRSPIVIPVINVIGKGVQTTVKTSSNGGSNGTSPEEKAKEDAISQARRFARLRQQLLGQEAYKN
ncbi:MAG TPA: ribonuclease J [Candidatus Saccharibacteria bacterium]|nr:ribonuclease J [Candidatus Saccharibacteria bacterium]